MGASVPDDDRSASFIAKSDLIAWTQRATVILDREGEEEDAAGCWRS
jgi:hypothetical protein